MKNILILFSITLLLSFFSCKKDCINTIKPIQENCDTSSLAIVDNVGFDLEKYKVRPDSSAMFGQATAIKSVPTKGEITWVANNRISKIGTEYYLLINNYADTTWRDLEFWAYHRENFFIKFDPNNSTFQTLLDEASYTKDNSVNYGKYTRRFDDVKDASWKIDLQQQSYILVTRFDKVTQIVEGEFHLNFILENKKTGTGNVYADKAQFRCGKFKAKIF